MSAFDFVRSIFKNKAENYTGGSMAQIFSNAVSGQELGRINPGNIEKYLSKYADQAWIYSCIRIIQSKGAGVPLKIYRRNGAENEELPDHPLKTLLDSVNPFMNGYDLMESTHGFIELAGNAYWLLDMIVDGKPTEIYPLNPKSIKIIADKKRNITGYAYEITPGIVDQTFEPSEIVHFKTWNPLDPFYGMAPICAARDSSETMYFSDQYNKAFFKNGAQPGGILTSEQGIDEASKKSMQSAWSKLHQGVRKSHKLAILDNGLKYQTIASTHQEMAFGELKRMSREDVLTVFNMPPIMVGVFDEANYSNAKEQRRIFWVDCMIPRLRKNESVINERLVKLWDATLIAKYDLSGVEDLAEDVDMRSRADSINVTNGIKTVNEIRKEKNLQPVPWGETWWAPFGLSPVNVSADDSNDSMEDEPNDVSDSEDDQESESKELNKNQPEQLPHVSADDSGKVIRDQIWIRYKDATERWEKKWAVQMRGLFADQEREVISNLADSDWKKTVSQNRLDKLRNVKQSVDLILFERSKWRTVFRKVAHSLMTYTVKASAQDEIDQYGLGIDFNLSDPNVLAWINNKSFKFAEEINKTTEDMLRNELTDAIKNGETLIQVEERIARVFDIARGSRTSMIARTEVISASNEGAFESYKQSGVVDKLMWITARDNRVREEHLIDGEQAPLGALFSNGLKYPGDPEGEPGNVINCRCTIAPIVEKGE